jgi:hypothetical protein
MDRVIQVTGAAISATFDAATGEIRQHLPGHEGAEPSKAADAPDAGESAKATSG